MSSDIKAQIEGAKYTYFGILQGVSAQVDLRPPENVFHFTSWKNFCLMSESNTLRLYTSSNFEDDKERRLRLPIEDRVNGTISDDLSGSRYDLSTIINGQLSLDHVFIQSNTISDSNKYLWKEYGDEGRGVCLRFSSKRYISYLNNTLPHFEHLPDFMKCCYISYDKRGLNDFMEHVLAATQSVNAQLGNAGLIVWFFMLEYWRNFLKTPDYLPEQEVRFVVSENYSSFLQLCSLLAKWGHFTTNDPYQLSHAFYQEYLLVKDSLHKRMGYSLSADGKSHFITVPLYEVLDSVTIGPKATFTKGDVTQKSGYRLRKSQITKSLLNLNT